MCASIVVAQTPSPAPTESHSPETAPLFARAKHQYVAKDYRAAADTYTEILAREPKNIEALFDRGKARYFGKDTDGSIGDMNAVLQSGENYEAHFYLGRDAYRKGLEAEAIAQESKAKGDVVEAIAQESKAKGETAEAIAQESKAIELKPSFEPAWSLRGDFRLGAKPVDFAAAESDMDRAIELNPSDPFPRGDRSFVYSQTRRFRQSIADATLALKKMPSFSNALLARGISEFALDNAHAADHDYTQYVNQEPEDAEGFALRGSERIFLPNLDGSVSDLQTALRLDPSNSKARKFLPQAYTLRAIHSFESFLSEQTPKSKGLSDFNNAVSDFNNALRLNPDFPLALFMRAFIRVHSGDFAGAERDARAVDRLKPNDAEIAALFAWIETGRHNRSAAIAAADRAIKLDPGAAEYVYRAVVRSQFCDPRGAIADLTTALHLDGSLGDAWYVRGAMRLSTGDYRGALSDETAALKLDPKSIYALVERGIAYKHLHDRDLALTDFSKAIALNSTDPIPLYDRATTLAGLAEDQYEAAAPDTTAKPSGASEAGTITGGSALFALRFQLPSVGWIGSMFSFARIGNGSAEAAEANPTQQRDRSFESALRDLAAADRLETTAHAPFTNHVTTLEAEGDILLNLHRYEDGIAAFSRALNIAPDDYESLLGRGIGYRHTNRRADALADFRHAVTVAQAHPTRSVADSCAVDHIDASEAYDELGEQLRIAGDYPGAIDALDHALKINAGDAEAFDDRAQVHEQLGDRAAAISDLQSAIRLFRSSGRPAIAGKVQAELNAFGP
jgi:tetratricopeptide (TPR) repeat protein